MARRTFDSTGKIKESHPVYYGAVREVVKKNNVPLIDLDKKSQALLQQFGPEDSKLLFLHLAPGEHPNYPDGKDFICKIYLLKGAFACNCRGKAGQAVDCSLFYLGSKRNVINLSD